MTKGEKDGRTVPGPKVDDTVGRVLGRRYRLVAPIGSGASARVYAAEDLSLGRKVAVKCLRTGLTDDLRFLKRFRAEAWAAAQLSHPNLLAVYDWGEDPSAAFIVTEILLGGSLRDLLDHSSLLTPSQGLLVALQVAQGLNYAHELGWVHRDIKPANLLFGEEGRLRIADFGIARAVAEAAWTEPEGVLIGTARYAAPEQALGELIDGKADVYSLALTVIEAVTGEVPLLRDNALGTMLLRQDEDVGDLSRIGPLGRPLTWAGRADPAGRPSAAQLIDALTGVARSLPRPRRLPLAGTRLGDGAGDEPTVMLTSRQADADLRGPGLEETVMLASRQGDRAPSGPAYPPDVKFSSEEPPEESPSPLRAGTAAAGPPAPSHRKAGGPPPGQRPAVAGPAAPSQSPGDRGGPAAPSQSRGDRGGPAAPSQSRGDRGGPAAPSQSPGDRGGPAAPSQSPGARGGPAAPSKSPGARGGPAAPSKSPGDRGGPAAGPPDRARPVKLTRLFEPDAPDIVPETIDLQPQAARRPERGALDVSRPPVERHAPGPAQASGRRWLPAAGALVAIMAALGAGYLALQATLDDRTEETVPTVPLPVVGDYVGQLLADVEEEAETWQLDITESRQDGTQAGEILDQQPPAGESLAAGEPLMLMVSQGPELRQLPELRGSTVADATGLLQDANLALGVITQSHDEAVAEGQILDVRVEGAEAALELETGTRVDLVVSAGPAPAPMPSFVGLTLDQAIDQAESLGLVLARDEAYSETYPESQVIDTDPPTDTPVRRGDTVRVVVSLGLPFITVPDVAGISPAEAADVLTAAGFVVVDTAGPPNQPVIGTSPAAGESHRKGTEIVILTTAA